MWLWPVPRHEGIARSRECVAGSQTSHSQLMLTVGMTRQAPSAYRKVPRRFMEGACRGDEASAPPPRPSRQRAASAACMSAIAPCRASPALACRCIAAAPTPPSLRLAAGSARGRSTSAACTCGHRGEGHRGEGGLAQGREGAGGWLRGGCASVRSWREEVRAGGKRRSGVCGSAPGRGAAPPAVVGRRLHGRVAVAPLLLRQAESAWADREVVEGERERRVDGHRRAAVCLKRVALARRRRQRHEDLHQHD